jgi:hypothetical protein
MALGARKMPCTDNPQAGAQIFSCWENWAAEVSPNSKEGFRLVRAFLSIRSAGRRRAVLEYVEDQARMDEAE